MNSNYVWLFNYASICGNTQYVGVATLNLAKIWQATIVFTSPALFAGSNYTVSMWVGKDNNATPYLSTSMGGLQFTTASGSTTATITRKDTGSSTTLPATTTLSSSASHTLVISYDGLGTLTYTLDGTTLGVSSGVTVPTSGAGTNAPYFFNHYRWILFTG